MVCLGARVPGKAAHATGQSDSIEEGEVAGQLWAFRRPPGKRRLPCKGTASCSRLLRLTVRGQSRGECVRVSNIR